MDVTAIQNIILLAANTAALIEKLLGGLSLSELGLALKEIEMLPSLITNAEQALVEWKALDDAAAAQLEAFVAANVQLNNKDAQSFIEESLDFLISLHKIFGMFKVKKG